MSAKCLVCFIFLLSATFIKITAANLPLIFRQYNFTDELVPVSAHFNPCKNFYGYACHSWTSNVQKPLYEPVWNPWIAVSHKIKLRLSKILTHYHDARLVKPRIFYRSCLHIVDNEKRYLEELLSLVENFGGWPLVERKKTKLDWFKILSEITRHLGIHPILKIYVDLDYQDPMRHMIYVEPGDLILPQHMLANPGYFTELQAYKKWILDTATHMYSNISDNVNTAEIKDIIKFEMHLAKMMQTKSKTQRSSIKELSKKFSTNWLQNIDHIFGDFIKVDSDTSTAVKNYEYLKNLFLLINQVGDKVATNYLIWSAIRDLSRETTRHMRDLNFLIDQAILGVKDDLSRDYECLDTIIKYFDNELVARYLKLYTSPEIFVKVRSMFDSIKDEFIHILKKNIWLSHEAKFLSVEKIKNIKLHLGYSLDTFTRPSIQDYYKKLQINNDHFTNILNLKKYKRIQHLLNFSGNKTTMWPSSVFDVNAYYSVLQNCIFIPMPLLEPPFFHLNRDEIFNYGALGFLIAHELSHSLDPVGILADTTGKMRKWWPEQDTTNYKKHIQCFGNSNTGEDMADQNGLRISLGAIRNKKVTRKLNDFFISFAQMWCETSENRDLFVSEEHSPDFDRVNSIVNFEEFGEAFLCDVGKLCELW